MNFAPNSKRIPTRPRDNRKVEEIEQDIADMKDDIEECKDVKGQMAILNERSQTLINQAVDNRTAIFGTPNTPGIMNRLIILENKIEEVTKFVADVKKLGYGVLIIALGIFIEILVQLVLTHGTILAK